MYILNHIAHTMCLSKEKMIIISRNINLEVAKLSVKMTLLNNWKISNLKFITVRR